LDFFNNLEQTLNSDVDMSNTTMSDDEL